MAHEAWIQVKGQHRERPYRILELSYTFEKENKDPNPNGGAGVAGAPSPQGDGNNTQNATPNTTLRPSRSTGMYDRYPQTKMFGGEINITMVTPDVDDMFFYEWVKDTNDHHDGEIKIQIPDGGELHEKIVTFEDAYCVKIYEEFKINPNSSNVPTEQMWTKITIFARRIMMGNSNFEVVNNGTDKNENN